MDSLQNTMWNKPHDKSSCSNISSFPFFVCCLEKAHHCYIVKILRMVHNIKLQAGDKKTGCAFFLIVFVICRYQFVRNNIANLFLVTDPILAAYLVLCCCLVKQFVALFPGSKNVLSLMQGLSGCRLHVLPLPAWVLCGYSGFLP